MAVAVQAADADVTSSEMQFKWQIELWRKYTDDLQSNIHSIALNWKERDKSLTYFSRGYGITK